MCIAAPMEIIQIDDDGRFGTAVFSGNELRVNLGLVSAKKGDRVLVHAGCAIQIVDGDQADEIADIFKELADLMNES